MPFISKDWRSPGEAWVKTDEGWERLKVLECGKRKSQSSTAPLNAKKDLTLNPPAVDYVDNETKMLSDVGQLGLAVSMAIDQFISIAECIADDNLDVKHDMMDFCKDASDAGKTIHQLCTDIYSKPGLPEHFRKSLILTSKSLLSSITRILLITDIVVVKHFLHIKPNMAKIQRKLEPVITFTDFVRAFSVFGIKIIELLNATSDRAIHSKAERRRAQMLSATQILERSIITLITSSKVCMVHNHCVLAKENRDTVFCQIRRAMDLLHFVIKDCIYDSCSVSMRSDVPLFLKNTESSTVFSALRRFTELIERFKPSRTVSSVKLMPNKNEDNPYLIESDQENMAFENHGSPYAMLRINNYLKPNESMYIEEMNDELLLSFEKLLEKIHDFTDSAFTSHENRESILLLSERCKQDLYIYLSYINENDKWSFKIVENKTNSIIANLGNLSNQLVSSVADQMMELYYSLRLSAELVNNFKTLILKNDLPSMQIDMNKFHECCEHITDVCKLLEHIACTETLQVQAKCLLINLRIYGPQVLLATKIASKYPSSSSAAENLTAFVEMWTWLSSEISSLGKLILESTSVVQSDLTSYKAPVPADKSMAGARDLEPPGGDKSLYPADGKTDVAPYNSNSSLNDNDILKRANNMSAMAFSMYQFSKGNGTLRTTQDLFTQAEYFAEEANRLYKVLRQFSYQVPASENKRDLLNALDRVPIFVQTLQFTVKDHTVGKAATFVKVDHVLQETKNLMIVINNVVSKCFECAEKYKLDLSSISGGLTSQCEDGNNAGGLCDNKGTTNSSEGSM